jgi:tetratricopeptide (TPR) repeat protein
LKETAAMKNVVAAIFGLVVFFSAYAQADHVHLKTGEAKTAAPSATDWQADLRYLQQVVHQDYPFLFKNVSRKDFDAEVEGLYNAIPYMQPHQVVAGLARIVSLFKYGHTSLSWRGSPVKYHTAPLNFYWFSDGLYVEGADPEYASLTGARLVNVEKAPVAEVLQKIKPLVPAENEQFFKANGLDFLTVPEALHAQGVVTQLKTSVTYTFEKDGKLFEQTVAAVPAFRFPRVYGYVKPGGEWVGARNSTGTPLYLKNLERIYYFEYLPQRKTVYVRHSQIQDDSTESTPAFYKRVFDFINTNDVEKLVLDVRLNGGGNNYKNKPIVTGIIESKKINQPGKLFVIIGRQTFSACQNLVNELSNYTNALFVGEPTAENINFYGDNRRIELPKTKTPVFLSFAWWQDKPQWENAPWLAPHLAVEMSFADYQANRDPVLEACLEFSDNDVVLDPVGRLKDLFEAGKLTELETQAKKMVADPRYKYVNFESKINQAGYELMYKKQMDPALYVFGLNTKLFPASANVWDSFAEANWKAGNIDKAIEYYNKAIEMDPDGPTGENARKMLQDIKTKKGI